MVTVSVVLVAMVEYTVVLRTFVIVNCSVVVTILVSVVVETLVTVSLCIAVEVLMTVCVSVTVDVWVVGVALAQKPLRNKSTFCSHRSPLQAVKNITSMHVYC